MLLLLPGGGTARRARRSRPSWARRLGGVRHRALEATNPPGDVLYMPAFWFHQVEASATRSPSTSGPRRSRATSGALWRAATTRALAAPRAVPRRPAARRSSAASASAPRSFWVSSSSPAAAPSARAPTPSSRRGTPRSRGATPEAAAADAARALCREAAAQQPGAAGGDRAVAPAIVHSYAAALRAADDRTRELLLDDLVESAAAWAVGALGDRDELIRERLACFAAISLTSEDDSGSLLHPASSHSSCVADSFLAPNCLRGRRPPQRLLAPRRHAQLGRLRAAAHAAAVAAGARAAGGSLRRRASDDKAEVEEYFNNEGFNRWNKIYSDSDEVNKVQMDIRDGHGQTVDKVLGWARRRRHRGGRHLLRRRLRRRLALAAARAARRQGERVGHLSRRWWGGSQAAAAPPARARRLLDVATSRRSTARTTR